jgi:hypothetical protein
VSVAAGVNLEPHELCLMFPAMRDDVYAKLVESVRKHGALKPIVLHEGKILDGRNRCRAYAEVGVDFECVDWDGECGTPLDYVLVENEVRRDLEPGQRAALAVEVQRRLEIEYAKHRNGALKRGDEKPEPVCQRIDKRDSIGEAAEKMGVNRQYVADAKRIQEASPETFEAVKKGDKSIPQAKRELGLAKPNPEPKARPTPEPETAAKPAAPKPKPAEPEAVEAIREERAEQAAKRDELTDEEWLAALPLSAELAGHALDKFRRDALDYRDLESTIPSETPLRKAVAEFLSRTKRRQKGRTPYQGFTAFRAGQLLSVEHPRSWFRCPTTDKGGCDGTGTVGTIGQCPMCFGRGYLPR